jgi:pimeloyl-ACP methyl ester carboxylesterase
VKIFDERETGTEMANLTANGIRIEYETFGDPGDDALLLIMGLGAQMIFWDDAFCRELAGRRLHVVRFDNRDCGLSSHFPDKGIPDVLQAVTTALSGGKVDSPYSLADMAADAVALLDGLGIARSHVVGASMGGMIAQSIAIDHPERVLSLTSIMSTTGNPELPPAKPEALAVLLTPTPSDRAQFLDHMVQSFRTIGSPGFELDEEGFRDRVVARQLVAALADGNRKPRLGSVRAPTLVIHGKQDPLVPLEAGMDTADGIPGARLLVIDGMGHDLPRGAWPQIIDAIADVASSGVVPS